MADADSPGFPTDAQPAGRPRMALGSPSGLPTPRPWEAIPFVVFGVLCVLTWKRWLLPFQDHPRELMTATRLADGEVLYLDVGTLYGPLPPYLDALALQLFGRHLDVFLTLRCLVALLGIAALGRLARRLFPDASTAGTAVALVVAACFFCYGSPWVFPYSVAALEGTVLLLWALELALSSSSPSASLAAGLLAGLGAGTKIEFFPAALLVPGPALLVRRPRREAATALGLAAFVSAVSLGGPILLAGLDAVTRHGYLIALRNPEPFQRVQELILFGGMTRQEFLAGGFVGVLFPSALFVAAAALVVRHGTWKLPGGTAAAFALGLAGLAVPRNEELSLLLPLAAVVAAADVVRLARAPDRATSAALATACVGLTMALSLWRQPFFLRIGVYTAFSGPLALLLALAFLARGAVPARVVALCAGLTLAQGVDRWTDFHTFPMRRLSFPRGSYLLPEEPASLVESSVALIRRLSSPGSRVWAWPEPGFLTFFGERRSTFVDEQFYPGQQGPASEAEMLARLAAAPPDLVFVTNRAVREFGVGPFGAGTLDGVAAALRRQMRPVARVGPAGPIPGLGMATDAIVLAPLGSAAPPMTR